MSVTTKIKQRKCNACRRRKIIGVEIISKRCRGCTRKGVMPYEKLPAVKERRKKMKRLYQLEICETVKADAMWHARGINNKRTLCGKAAMDAPQYVRQGAPAVRALVTDAGACKGCVEMLVGIFREADALN